jgi:poly(hydroxyalkanoate) depolymerase family esterase
MRPLSDTLERLARFKKYAAPHSPTSRLVTFEPPVTNPGQLSAQIYVPASLAERPALVVILHGCTQTAGGYDDSAGWSRLADEFGFVVLYPEQGRENNANVCFNWFVPEDIMRESGEALSIRQLVEAATVDYDVDRKRIFISGLSAGGAMANVMLATYPEVFAGGAIIAGLPYGTASTVPEAFDRMRGHGIPAPDRLRQLLRAAAPAFGDPPTISIWHGTSDGTVSDANAAALVEQWRGVLNLESTPTSKRVAGKDTTSVWTDRLSQPALCYHSISGMGHGTPLDVSNGDEKTSPFMLDVGISSTRQIAYEWGLTPSFDRRATTPDTSAAGGETPIPRQLNSGIQETIESALRSAGLMK